MADLIIAVIASKRTRNRKFAARLSWVSMVVVALTSIAQAQTAIPATADHVMGLREAVDRSLEKNPSFQATKEKINQADEQVSYVRSVLFPTVTLLGVAGEQKDALNSRAPQFGGDPYNSYSSDLNVKWPLFTYGSFTAVESARKDRELRKLDREISQRSLLSNVVQAYFQVALYMRNVDTYKRQYKIEEESLAVAERRSHTGRGQVLDVLQVKTQLALIKSQIATAQNQVETAAATLANWLSEPKTKVVRVKNFLEAPDLSVIDKTLNLTGFRLPELEQNRLQIDQIADQKTVALGQHLPSLSLSGDYYYKSTKMVDWYSDTSASWALGLQLTIPLFSGWSSRYQQEIYNSQRRALEYDRVNIENNANLQQVTSRKQLETAAQVIVEGKEALRLATASSDEARRMFRFSTIDFVQFLQVETSYVQAEQTLNNQKYQYLLALVNYFVATGQDLSKLVDVLDGASK